MGSDCISSCSLLIFLLWLSKKAEEILSFADITYHNFINYNLMRLKLCKVVPLELTDDCEETAISETVIMNMHFRFI